ncbi:WhiB family transcriptional regulator [Devriesea agamarum]|uniref:WhiB family transcriptional regulator n=1 Tax=Devriesea agamarum TaxID=472569 RepID=UPI00071CA096|nr:WhiB family transcriptional regulator [Devriesea agamarum]
MTDVLISDMSTSLPCQEVHSELFFAESPADLARAKALCAECPLQQACLDGARQRREPWGVWGGEIFVDGATVAVKRPRGRPRKTAVA